MKRYLLSILILSSFAHAHEPYLAPISYTTSNTQIPVIAAYAEEAFNAEHALKQATLSVIQPDQKKITINAESNLKSATLFNLPLAEVGTYQLSSSVSYPLKYVQYQKKWKTLSNVSAEKAGKVTDRDYAILADFKKAPEILEVTREWSIQSYISKEKTSEISTFNESPIQVEFKTHPNSIHAQQPVQVKLKKSGQALNNAEFAVRAQGQSEEQAKHIQINTDGTATLNFPHPGQYLVEVNEKVNPNAKPSNQYYTIISLGVLPAVTP